MVLKPAPHGPHCQVWLPVWNEPQPLEFHLKLLSRSRAHLSLFLSQVGRLSGWSPAQRTPFSLLQCSTGGLSLVPPIPFSHLTQSFPATLSLVVFFFSSNCTFCISASLALFHCRSAECSSVMTMLGAGKKWLSS